MNDFTYFELGVIEALIEEKMEVLEKLGEIPPISDYYHRKIIILKKMSDKIHEAYVNQGLIK